MQPRGRALMSVDLTNNLSIIDSPMVGEVMFFFSIKKKNNGASPVPVKNAPSRADEMVFSE